MEGIEFFVLDEPPNLEFLDDPEELEDIQLLLEYHQVTEKAKEKEKEENLIQVLSIPDCPALDVIDDDDDDIVPLFNMYIQLMGIIPSMALITDLLFPNDPHLRSEPRDVFLHLSRFPRLFWFMTGETPDTFRDLHVALAFAILQPRNVRLKYPIGAVRIPRGCLLSTINRLLLVFIWLRQYPSLRCLSSLFGINITSIDDDIHHIVPMLRAYFRQEIRWPTMEEFDQLRGSWPDFVNAVLAVDGTIHRVWKPLIGQREYFRGDKRCHFLLSQVCVDPHGIIRNLETGFKGHMNDMGDYNRSRLGRRELPMPAWAKVLADGGYFDDGLLVVPWTQQEAEGNELRLQMNERHRHYRSVVERTILVMKHYKCVSHLWKNHKWFQGTVAYLVGCLANRKIRLQQELRNN